MSMGGDRNKFWPKGESTSGWQNQDFLFVFKCTMNSLVLAPGSGNDRGQTCSCYGKIHWRDSNSRHCWRPGEVGGRGRTRQLLPDALGRLSRLLKVTVTHPQLSAEAHYTSISMDLKMINSNLHPYISTLTPCSPTFPKLPLGGCVSWSGDSSNDFFSVILSSSLWSFLANPSTCIIS